jgi:hypothetical protein
MTLPRRATLFSRASAVVIVLLGVFHLSYPATGQQASTRWVTAWSTSQQVLGEDQISNATVRMLARVTVPGEAIRVRLDNTFGSEPVTIARAFVGHRIRGAQLAAGSNRPITFAGGAEVTIPAGGTISSDPVSLAVRAQQDIAVSMHVRGTAVRPSQHTNAAVTSYRSADSSGDVAANESAAPFEMTTTATWWLKAVDVLSPSPSTIVAFGDSITDGTCSTLDAHDRWENVLSVRLGLENDATFRSRDRATASRP